MKKENNTSIVLPKPSLTNKIVTISQGFILNILKYEIGAPKYSI